jgi:dTDP-4-amino-4,6-dideoxy-D-galactose acyltransferase
MRLRSSSGDTLSYIDRYTVNPDLKQDRLCTLLDWDSEFFGARIARVESSRLTPESIEKIIGWSDENRIDCLYFLCAPDDDQSVIVAENAGFHLVDVRLELSARASHQPASQKIAVRPFQESDLSELLGIAADVYTDSRFYYDRNFPREKVSALYREWISNSCRGYADAVLIAEHQKSVGGFITCHIEQAILGRIGLVGVGDSARGLHLGSALVKSALNYFNERGVTEVRVVTQGRNIAAQRLYQANNFRTSSLHLWYHKWFGDDWRIDG